MSGVGRLAAERHQRQLEELLSQPGNDVCADCKSKSPRWASHNLGIFICMRCAGLHRKLGTHISKVKSVTLDSWTKDQVEAMRKVGNAKSNQIWNPDERKNPLPDNMEESERDSEMEKYIRSKYQFGRFKSKSAIVESFLGPSQSRTSLPARSQTAPIRSGTPPTPRTVAPTEAPPLPVVKQNRYPTVASSAASDMSAAPQPRMSSLSIAPAASSIASPQRTTTLPPFSPAVRTAQPSAPVASTTQQSTLSSSTFEDLISLQGTATASSLPLQYQNTSIPSNPYASLSPGGMPSSIPNDRSPVFRSASLPSQSYGQQLAPVTGASSSSSFNPFFQQQQQQQQMPFQQSHYNSFTPTIPPVSAPSPFNPFSQPLQQQVQMASPPPELGQSQGMMGMNPVAPKPQMFSMTTNSFQATQSPSPFGMVNGTQPYQQTPSPSFTMMQPPVQSPSQMQMQWQQQPQQPGSLLSQQAQQAQQLFKSMVGGNDGSGRNPFVFS